MDPYGSYVILGDLGCDWEQKKREQKHNFHFQSTTKNRNPKNSKTSKTSTELLSRQYRGGIVVTFLQSFGRGSTAAVRFAFFAIKWPAGVSRDYLGTQTGNAGFPTETQAFRQTSQVCFQQQLHVGVYKNISLSVSFCLFLFFIFIFSTRLVRGIIAGLSQQYAGFLNFSPTAGPRR